MAPKATGEFLSEAAPSAQFLLTFPKAFHSYPLETAPHSLNSPSRKKKKKEEEEVEEEEEEGRKKGPYTFCYAL